MARCKIIYIHNGNADVFPSADKIELGELAVNYNATNEAICFKNSTGDVIVFPFGEMVDVPEVVYETLTDLNNRLDGIDTIMQKLF